MNCSCAISRSTPRALTSSSSAHFSDLLVSLLPSPKDPEFTAGVCNSKTLRLIVDQEMYVDDESSNLHRLAPMY
ncbi:hypothetical protein M0R45_010806 [Rubus argutus]|uniref:Uncharacterized protein n=1 Tax=Rubus argutus TaxID=59490 RepID=A0AAW1YAN5_RUBAR